MPEPKYNWRQRPPDQNEASCPRWNSRHPRSTRTRRAPRVKQPQTSEGDEGSASASGPWLASFLEGARASGGVCQELPKAGGPSRQTHNHEVPLPPTPCARLERPAAQIVEVGICIPALSSMIEHGDKSWVGAAVAAGKPNTLMALASRSSVEGSAAALECGEGRTGSRSCRQAGALEKRRSWAHHCCMMLSRDS